MIPNFNFTAIIWNRIPFCPQTHASCTPTNMTEKIVRHPTGLCSRTVWFLTVISMQHMFNSAYFLNVSHKKETMCFVFLNSLAILVQESSCEARLANMQQFKALVVLLVFAAVCISFTDAWTMGAKKGKRKWFFSISFVFRKIYAWSRYITNKIVCSIIRVKLARFRRFVRFIRENCRSIPLLSLLLVNSTGGQSL